MRSRTGRSGAGLQPQKGAFDALQQCLLSARALSA
jgi:hypothetical protein